MQTARVHLLLQKAYDHRDRLSDEERFLTEAAYFTNGPHQDNSKVIAAYEAALEVAPEEVAALNNLGLLYLSEGNFAKAEPLYRRALAADSTINVVHAGLVTDLAGSGRLADADKEAAKAERLFPRGATDFGSRRVGIAWAAGQMDSAARLAERLPALAGRSATQRSIAASTQANVALARGKLGAAEKLREAQDSALTESGARAAHLGIGLSRAFQEVWFQNDRASAAHRTEAALAATPLASLDPVNRPHVALVRAQAFAGKVDAAKATLADFEGTRRGISLTADATQRAQMTADIAMAERRYDAAAVAYRDAAPPQFPWARLPDLARAYDLGGHADSAIAVYARYAAGSEYGRLATDAIYLGPSLKRLGELYEAKGDRDNAAKEYARFVELWKNADPELQGSVTDAKARLVKLRVSEARKP
jgi:tetratricopeptide (TPR) repeat protein